MRECMCPSVRPCVPFPLACLSAPPLVRLLASVCIHASSCVPTCPRVRLPACGQASHVCYMPMSWSDHISWGFAQIVQNRLFVTQSERKSHLWPFVINLKEMYWHVLEEAIVMYLTEYMLNVCWLVMAILNILFQINSSSWSGKFAYALYCCTLRTMQELRTTSMIRVPCTLCHNWMPIINSVHHIHIHLQKTIGVVPLMMYDH